MVIVMKPSWKSPDEGLGYCTGKCQGSIPGEGIREPRSRCGGCCSSGISVLAGSSDGAGSRGKALADCGRQNRICAEPSRRGLGALPAGTGSGGDTQGSPAVPESAGRACARGHAGDGQGAEAGNNGWREAVSQGRSPHFRGAAAQLPPLSGHSAGVPSSAAAIRL